MTTLADITSPTDLCPLCQRPPIEPEPFEGTEVCATCLDSCPTCGGRCLPGDPLCMTCLRDLPVFAPAEHQAPVAAFIAEFIRSRTLFRPFASALEGVWVLKEEIDELWEAVRADDDQHAVQEATQVGAMALGIITEVGPEPLQTNIFHAQTLIQHAVLLSRDQRPQPCASAHEGFGRVHHAFDKLLKAVNDDRPMGTRLHAATVAAATARFMTEISHQSTPAIEGIAS